MDNIKSEYITRIYISRDQFEKEIIQNPDEPIGPYFEIQAEKRGRYDIHTPVQAMCEWRSAEKTKDCLPVSLLDNQNVSLDIKTRVMKILK